MIGPQKILILIIRLNSKFIGKLKNINYETKNISSYKQDQTSEFFGALGYLSEIELIKKNSRTNSQSLLTPKLLLRYASRNNEKRRVWKRITPAGAFLTLDRC